MEYITIKNNKITGHFCGALPVKKEKGTVYQKIIFFGGKVGEDVRSYVDLKKWKYRPLYELVETGIVSVPADKKLSGDGLFFIDLSKQELIDRGLLTLKPEEKLEGEYIVPKTSHELYAAGLITPEQYNEYIIHCRAGAYRSEADPLGFQVLRGEITMDRWLRKIAEIKKRFPKV
jgi:hypothetical protein